VGLFQNDANATEGYTLINKSGSAFLIDNAGLVVHTWLGASNGHPGYLLENGNLLLQEPGLFREITWDSIDVWSFSYSGAHHDIEPLPNGNVLMVARETITNAEAIAAGRDPALLDDDLRLLVIVEVAFPGVVVWVWRLRDHLVQDFDALKPNYDVIADTPERADINYMHDTGSDWNHTNSVDYNPALEQIIVSLRRFNEVWIIDHSTTTAQAATGVGGNSGMGGDLLYRWGNPLTYEAGVLNDQQLFGQHDAQWIEPGLPGAGNILIYNNGTPKFNGPGYSTILEITPPTNGFVYAHTPGSAYLPLAPTWTYEANPSDDFDSEFAAGVQRLPGGNTLICEAKTGRVFEVTMAEDTVWEYVSPWTDTGALDWNEVPAPEGPRQANTLFQSNRYPVDHPAFAGKSLIPTGEIEIWDSYANLTLQSGAGGEQVGRPDATFAYGVGQLVTLIAEPDPGYEFANWSIVSGSASIGDPTVPHTTFTMGASDATVQANFSSTSTPVPSGSFWGTPLAFLLMVTAIAGIRSNGRQSMRSQSDRREAFAQRRPRRPKSSVSRRY
jgi:hypothetical protein